ncbi:hypothetical protein QQS21_007105 [Conoideocrella luteorostrata]|uniref:Uncharacterized protein n=1 Tax=Conoideocrella luteorostrata TaxID=1105319 RepID=A0AAJ0FZR8_9HYPO|nr:hypothetical protein QQS21_007105 [Conoideocrella luteorostrata]
MEQHTDNENPILILLGFDSLDQLEALPVKERRTILTEHLVADESLELDESHTLKAEPQEYTLRVIIGREKYSNFERELAKEARRIFYQDNQFVLWSTHLNVFLQGDYGDRTSCIPVYELVKDIVIGLACYRGDFDSNAMALQEVLCFTNLECLSIELWGHGALDGSDLPTQRMIHAVSKTVKQIIRRDNLHVTVSKVFMDWNNYGAFPHDGWMKEVRDLRSYWNMPADDVIEKVKEGVGSFEELMQVQIAIWTDPHFVSNWFENGSVNW